MAERSYDVVMVGAGMVGATAACLLARAGYSVAVIEAREPAEYREDSPVGLRVSALSPGAAAILEQAGAWKAISRQRHCAYRRMQVEDRQARQRLDLTAGEFGMERLGTIVENDLVQWSLWQCLQNLGGIELLCPAQISDLRLDSDQPVVSLADGRQLATHLLVGADGADSVVRQALGIEQDYWCYAQQGIVGVVETARPNAGVAWQRFLPGGPLALLPLADGRSSMVWTRPSADAQRLLGLEDAEFLAELNAALQAADDQLDEFPGGVRQCGKRAAFDLSMQLGKTYASGRTALIGDAAHVVHPLAGQGVNLGLLDAAALVETVLQARQAGESPVSERSLQRFARWRRSESEIMARGIDSLRTLFGVESLAPLRQLGLAAVSRSWVLKDGFIRRAAGRNQNAPALARGISLAQLMAA